MSTEPKQPAKTTRKVAGIRRSLAALSLAATTVTGGALLGPSPVSAQAPGTHYFNHCWFVADGSNGTAADWMSDYDLINDVETTATVATGTNTMEAIVFHYPTAQLFATDGGQFGVIDLTPGATYGNFTPIGSGGLGDVDGLAFDSTTGNLWATNRNAAADTLFRIDHTTGAQVGPTITIAPTTYRGPLNGGGSTVLDDIDDLAIDPVTGNFYAIANGEGALDMLVIIDPSDGSTTPVGSPADSGIQDIEGLGFTPAGQLIGTSGSAGGASANSIVDIDKSDGTATPRNDALTHIDQEAVDCLTNAYTNPGITIEKATNGQDADAAPGPFVAVNGDVTWTYVITNTGNLALFDIALTDDVEGVIACTLPNPLLPGQSTTCTHTITSAQAGQYTNIGSVVGTPIDLVGLGYSIDPASGEWLDTVGNPADFTNFDVAISYPLANVSDNDPSHYFGSAPQIDIEVATNGQDADTPTGPSVAPGSTVTWTYTVTNPGNVPVSNVVVADDNGTPGTPADDFAPTYVSGDTNGDGILDTNETWIYTATGPAATGQYNNDATVDGTGPLGTPVDDLDPTHHLGEVAGTADLTIEKATNGEDADATPGPSLSPGDAVTWTYVVSNTGNTAVTGVTITDDVEGNITNCDWATPGVVPASATVTCTLTGTATAGQYTNNATADGTGPDGPLTDSDPSHYLGLNPSIVLEKSTNGQDADAAPGPTIITDSTVTWTYRVTNDGNVDLTDVVVTDDQEGAVCTIPSLPAGETAFCEMSATAVAGQYTNLGTVAATSPQGPVGDTDPSHYTGQATATLSIEKATNGDDADVTTGPMVGAGAPVTWTYELTNTGDAAVTGVTITDDVEGNITNCDWATPGVVTASGTVTCTLTGTATAGQYTNNATADGTGPAGPLTDQDPSNYFGADPRIDIEVATNGQDADTPTGPLVAENGTVTWTYVVTNPGNVPVSDVVVADDNGTPGTPADDFAPTYVSGDTNGDGLLDPSETWTYTATGTASTGQYNNDATVDGTGPTTVNPDGTTNPGAPVADIDPTHHIGGQAGIDIEKATNGDDADAATGPVLPAGAPVTWTYVVTNTGDAPLTNVTITDDVEGPVCVIPTLAAGADDTCTLAGTASTGQYVNTGSVSATGPDGTVGDTDGSHHFGANPAIDIETSTNGEDADDTDGPTVPIGSTVTWTYDITNTGNVDLINVVITDDLGGVVCTIPILRVGETHSCELEGTASAGVYENIGSVRGTPVDALGNPIEDPATSQPMADVTDVDPTHHNGLGASINIEKDTNGAQADTDADAILLDNGDAVTWTYVVTNNGDADLVDVVVTDDIEGAVCTIASLPAGATETCTLTGVAVTGQYRNEGAVTAQPVDDAGNPLGTPVSDTDLSGYDANLADLAIVKTIDGELIAGADGVYVLSVDNLGPSTATGVTVIDILPDGLTYNSVSGTGWTCSAVLQTVTCTRPSIAVGENVADIRINVSVADNMGGRTVVNQAIVDSEQSDPVLTNNNSNVSVIGSNPVTQGTSTTVSSNTSTTVRVRSSLPVTGSNAGNLALVASLMIAAGGLLIIPTRRRAEEQD